MREHIPLGTLQRIGQLVDGALHGLAKHLIGSLFDDLTGAAEHVPDLGLEGYAEPHPGEVSGIDRDGESVTGGASQ